MMDRLTLVGTNSDGSGDGDEGNVISNNCTVYRLVGSGTIWTVIAGNTVGLSADGSTARGNSLNGIEIFGGATTTTVGGTGSSSANLISANGDNGVAIADTGTSDNYLMANVIGLNRAQTLALGNTNQGVWIGGGASNNIVGGVFVGMGNIITGSTYAGIEINGATSTGNALLGNRIYGNGEIGINLVGGIENSFGVTSNDPGDADTGANNLQNLPLLYAATVGAGNLTITGELRSAVNTTYRLEFFRSALGTEDPSGYGEGGEFLTSLDVTTDASGFASFNYSAANSWGVVSTDRISSTATEIVTGNFRSTSEFSMNVPVVNTNSAPVQTVPSAQAVNEDTVLSFSGISVNDTDGNLANTQLAVTNGVLTVNLAGGAVITAGANGGNTLTLSGTQAQINLALSTLTYQGNLNFNGGDTLTVFRLT